MRHSLWFFGTLAFFLFCGITDAVLDKHDLLTVFGFAGWLWMTKFPPTWTEDQR